MAAPANLYPGLNEVSDVLEEMPLEVSRYLTLLREIDAKCVHTVPELNGTIEEFFREESGMKPLQKMNGLFQDLMPSLEEKMHVSALAYESLSRLTGRLELAYEVAIKNSEIPANLRLGNDNHPAMHLHHELMSKIESKSNSKSSQALKSESRREAMAARRTGPAGPLPPIHASGNPNDHHAGPQPTIDGRKRRAMAAPVVSTSQTTNPVPQTSTVNAGSTSPNPSSSELKKRKRKLNTKEDYSQRPKTNEYGEALYCYCNQVAYGEMVGCDGDSCILEWFHLPCIGLETLPKGKWYCNDCKRAL
ncbi:LANO_0H13388g1_1 [Lachancea nothofagi CBS 11611]|uniref:Chromatin modification-related protein n=1 Tax=Lachancea nothofagi CBS 11611 TaxID=1266666 RepID=A0A1G4KMR0_9SACH|nr:LANO_0H13388g1_1 [Lachancea nothofagi CBS 11611]